MVAIKLCGLTRRCDAVWANECRPEYVGFVFARSRRCVRDEQAAQLRQVLRPDIEAVGVFVNEPIDHIAALVQRGIIQLVQLHGTEDASYVQALRRAVSVPIIQAYSIHCRDDMKKALQSTAEFILLDHGAGGTGQPFDWTLICSVNRPYFLAGGLSPDTAADAVRLRPYGVDVSSGIETNGVKDREKMRAFVSQVRQFSY